MSRRAKYWLALIRCSGTTSVIRRNFYSSFYVNVYTKS
jgi:hypothetical protein